MLWPLDTKGLKPWSAVSIQHQVTVPLILREAFVSAVFGARVSRVPLTKCTGIVSRGKCSDRSRSGLPAGCSG